MARQLIAKERVNEGVLGLAVSWASVVAGASHNGASVDQRPLIRPIVRRQLIEDRAVDAVVAVGPNMFYTVTLPVTLWFLDRGKKKTPRADKVLFLDARHLYRQIDRAHRDWMSLVTGIVPNARSGAEFR